MNAQHAFDNLDATTVHIVNESGRTICSGELWTCPDTRVCHVKRWKLCPACYAAGQRIEAATDGGLTRASQ